MSDLEINQRISIPASELTWTAVRASGSGGQNVNKVATKIDLRFDLDANSSLPAGAKARLRELVRNRLDADGRVVITSQTTRDQSKNLEDARQRLRALVLTALPRPKPRRATRPSKAAKRRRREDKRRRGEVKRGRGKVTE